MADTQKPKKSLDQIVSDTLSSNFGISNDDLALLFEDEPKEQTAEPTQVANTPSTETVTPSSPAVEPTKAADAEPTPPVTKPEPQKVVESASDKSKDLEDKLAAVKEQLAALTTLIQEKEQRAKADVKSAVATAVNPLDEITDQTIIQNPKQEIVKTVYTILKAALPAAFQEYDQALTSRQIVNEFARTHADFEEMRPIMRQIVAEDPTNNDNMAALPRVYEEAKKRKRAALEAMKRELNISEPAPASAPAPAQPALSEEEVLAKLEQRIADRIKKRKAAAGSLTPEQSTPVSPSERQAPRAVEKPMTEDEKLFADMLNAGPPSQQFLRGLELIAKK